METYRGEMGKQNERERECPLNFEYYTDQSATVTMTELTEQPVSVTAWTATTKDDVRRDFRLTKCGKGRVDRVCTNNDDIDMNSRVTAVA